MSFTTLHTPLIKLCYLIAAFFSALPDGVFLYLYICRKQNNRNQLSGNGFSAMILAVINQSIQRDIGSNLSGNST